jgi:hypothetical protein
MLKILARDAALRSIKEVFLMFFYLLTRPFRMESKIGLFKTILSFLVACYLVANVLILPLIDGILFKHDEKLIYLNILEPPQYAKNSSYLCEFKISSLDKAILSYNQSYDGRRISISTGNGDFQKKNCKQYYPGYLFNDYFTKGTIINVFYSGNMYTTLNSTAGYQEMITISSDLPMKMFIRNKKAIIIQHSPFSGTLTRGIAHLDHSVKEVFSLSNNYLNYSRDFVFKNGDTYGGLTVYNPRVFAYELPLLNENDATSHASFRHDPKFTVNLHMPQKRFGESVQAFFKIEGRIANRDPMNMGTSNFQVAAFDYIDTEDLSYFSKYWYYGKPFVYGIGSLFLMFFLINFITLKSGTKLSDVTYRQKPHLDDVIKRSAGPEKFGYPTKQD